MASAIKNHLLSEAKYDAAKAIRQKIVPEILVLHDTAGRLDKGSSVRWLKNNPNNTSVHLVLEIDGSLTQLVPFDHRANHAGASEWHGRPGCNNFSIGIEIVNPGLMAEVDGQTVRAHWGQEFDKAGYRCQYAKTQEHGAGWWMHYTPKQLQTLERIVPLLVQIYDLKDVVGHFEISPGRKVDVNPLFPLQKMRALSLGRDLAIDNWANEEADAQTNIVYKNALVIHLPGNSVTLRKWPGDHSQPIAEIPDGTALFINRSGKFPADVPEGQQSLWHNVTFQGKTGWLKPATFAQDEGYFMRRFLNG